MLAILLSKLSPKIRLLDALRFWQSYWQEQIDKILELTKQMNAKRLPPAEQGKLPPGSTWSNNSATSGEGSQLRWLYDPDIDESVERWVVEQER
jgi:hypothetical protein